MVSTSGEFRFRCITLMSSCFAVTAICNQVEPGAVSVVSSRQVVYAVCRKFGGGGVIQPRRQKNSCYSCSLLLRITRGCCDLDFCVSWCPGRACLPAMSADFVLFNPLRLFGPELPYPNHRKLTRRPLRQPHLWCVVWAEVRKLNFPLGTPSVSVPVCILFCSDLLLSLDLYSEISDRQFAICYLPRSLWLFCRDL